MQALLAGHWSVRTLQLRDWKMKCFEAKAFIPCAVIGLRGHKVSRVRDFSWPVMFG
jgi:hypothetical protein